MFAEKVMPLLKQHGITLVKSYDNEYDNVIARIRADSFDDFKDKYRFLESCIKGLGRMEKVDVERYINLKYPNYLSFVFHLPFDVPFESDEVRMNITIDP